MRDFFKTKIAELMASSKGTTEKTIEVVSILNNEVMEPLRENNAPLFWGIMRKTHEIYNGCHYDNTFAIYEVSQMKHTDSTGKVIMGEYWTMDEIKVQFEKYKAKLPTSTTVADMYVALHSWWHDNICQDRADFEDAADIKNIERGVKYFFCDEDAPEGKIWRYYKGMRADCY